MPTMAEVREKYPQYQDLSDEQLAQGLHKKFYSDMPYEQFAQKVGLSGSRMETDDEVNARVASKYGNMSFGDKVKGDLKSMVSNSVPVARGAWDAVSFIPGLAADAGVGIRNLLTGSTYELPSRGSERELDAIAPMPDVPGAGAVRAGTSMIVGGKLPTPQISNPAPAGFTKPMQDAVRQSTLKNSQSAGYVVPPATTNPTIANKMLESLGGKIATAQDAATRNQDVTNTLAKRAIGLAEDAPLTQESLSAIRGEAGDAYKVLRSVGTTAIDDATAKSLDAIASKFTGSKLKEALGAGTDIPKIVQAIKEEPFTGDTAVDAIDLLRGKADVAYRNGDKELGKAYKSLSKSIEDLMEKQLSGDALKNFRDSRQLIAKTHSVEGAFNPATGNVAATKLAAQLTKKKPLSGDLKTIAQFGQAFPKAAQQITDSGSVRNTDVIMGAGASGLSKEPWWLMYPFVRQAARAALLSKQGQKLAVTGPSGQISPEIAMALLNATNQLGK
jgi:hypothetical protein